MKGLLKKIIPIDSAVFKFGQKIYHYKSWHPKHWKFDIVKAYAAYGIAKLCQGRDDVAVSLTVKLIGMAQQ